MLLTTENAPSCFASQYSSWGGPRSWAPTLPSHRPHRDYSHWYKSALPNSYGPVVVKCLHVSFHLSQTSSITCYLLTFVSSPVIYTTFSLCEYTADGSSITIHENILHYPLKDQSLVQSRDLLQNVFQLKSHPSCSRLPLIPVINPPPPPRQPYKHTFAPYSLHPSTSSTLPPRLPTHHL